MTIAELNRELERRQQELAPKEDLGEYVGQWVILRNGRVIASSPDPKELPWLQEARRTGSHEASRRRRAG